MKVTVDLDKLLDEGKITQAEHDKFSQFAARDTAHLAFNILVGFGVIAVGGALLALLPSAMTAVVLGLIISVIGLALLYARIEQWQVLANICILVGTLLFGGGVIKEGEGSIEAFLLVAAAFGGASIFARSALMAVLAVLALSSCLGVRTGYLHAAYFLGVQEPAWTVALFSVFSLATYQLSKRLPLDFQGITIRGLKNGRVSGEFRFLDRLPVGRSRSERRFGSQPLDLHHPLGNRLDCGGGLGLETEPAMVAECGRGIRRDPLLHPVV